MPPSRVYGVATFYNFFSLKPPGDHTVILCEGTVCYMLARDTSPTPCKALRRGAGRDEPRRKGLRGGRALFGSCALAPVLVIDGQLIGNSSPEAAVARVREVLA